MTLSFLTSTKVQITMLRLPQRSREAKLDLAKNAGLRFLD
jgi:hypothetical protein